MCGGCAEAAVPGRRPDECGAHKDCKKFQGACSVLQGGCIALARHSHWSSEGFEISKRDAFVEWTRMRLAIGCTTLAQYAATVYFIYLTVGFAFVSFFLAAGG